MGTPNLKEQVAILRESADRFEEMARTARDHEERTAMKLVARSVRSAAKYAWAAGLARAERARMRALSTGA